MREIVPTSDCVVSFLGEMTGRSRTVTPEAKMIDASVFALPFCLFLFPPLAVPRSFLSTLYGVPGGLGVLRIVVASESDQVVSGQRATVGIQGEVGSRVVGKAAGVSGTRCI